MKLYGGVFCIPNTAVTYKICHVDVNNLKIIGFEPQSTIPFLQAPCRTGVICPAEARTCFPTVCAICVSTKKAQDKVSRLSEDQGTGCWLLV